jgi:ABC-type spermidine/putrescine transport system permease subunit II
VPFKATGIIGPAILIALGLVLLFATWTKLHTLYPETQSRILFTGVFGIVTLVAGFAGLGVTIIQGSTKQKR